MIEVFQINYKDEIVEVSFDRETDGFYWRGRYRFSKKTYNYYPTYEEALEAKKRILAD